MAHFDLLIIGDEILSGKRQDQHFAFARDLFTRRGLGLASVRMIGDDRAAIIAALRFSRQQRWRVLSCGGIGATPDDHTRQAAAAAFDRALVPHPEAQALIRQRIQEGSPTPLDFASPEMQQRLQMGEFPAGADLIPNPYNRIAGFSLEEHYFLPGFPVMAQPMMEWVLQTYYAAEFVTLARREIAFIVYEIAESRLTPLMESLEIRYPAIKVFSLPAIANSHPKIPRSHIELGVKLAPEANSPPAQAQLQEAAQAMQEALTDLGCEFVAVDA